MDSTNTYQNSSAGLEESSEIGAGEYILEGTDMNLLLDTNFVECTGEVHVEYYYRDSGKAYLTCRNLGIKSSTAILPILDYPNYIAYNRETNEILKLEKASNNRIGIEIPAGFCGSIVIEYKPPVLWRIFEVISLIGTCYLIIGLSISRKVKHLL